MRSTILGIYIVSLISYSVEYFDFELYHNVSEDKGQLDRRAYDPGIGNSMLIIPVLFSRCNALFFIVKQCVTIRNQCGCLITLSGETLSDEIFVGRNYSSGKIFVTKRKIPHFRPTKNFAQEK